MQNTLKCLHNCLLKYHCNRIQFTFILSNLPHKMKVELTANTIQVPLITITYSSLLMPFILLSSLSKGQQDRRNNNLCQSP